VSFFLLLSLPVLILPPSRDAVRPFSRSSILASSEAVLGALVEAVGAAALAGVDRTVVLSSVVH
jgi:hypothetical protein